MEFPKPVIEHNEKGGLSKFIIGICDTCTAEIDNSKEAYIVENGKIYHANNKCYIRK